ncbi:MAG: hypothetical protein MI923_19775 [Phycisphaerales bacterium]|nr:hypothetical protein [Phycisphaerales bacterium]
MNRAATAGRPVISSLIVVLISRCGDRTCVWARRGSPMPYREKDMPVRGTGMPLTTG